MSALQSISLIAASDQRLDFGLNPPVEVEELTAAENAIGIPLPAELRELYLAHDGQKADAPGLFFGMSWLPIREVLRELATWRSIIDDLAGALDAEQRSDPPDAIAEVYWHPMWFPLATSEDGNFLAVDLAPGRRGTVGQVINAGRDQEISYVLAASVTEFLERELHHVQAGATGISEIDGHPLFGLDSGQSHFLWKLHMFLSPFQDQPVLEPDPSWVDSLDVAWQRHINNLGLKEFLAATRFYSHDMALPSFEPLTRCSRLKELVLWREPPLEDLYELPALEGLRDLNVAAKSFDGINRFPELTRVILANQVPSADLRALPRARKLAEVWFGPNQRDVAALLACRNLKRVRATPPGAGQWSTLAGCSGLTDLEIEAPHLDPTALDFSTFSELAGLTINLAPSVSLRSLANHKRLKRITLRHCHSVDVSPLATCPELASVEFSMCEDLLGVEALQNARNLRDIVAGFSVFETLKDHLPHVRWSAFSGPMTEEQQAALFAFFDARQNE
jgi:internalin A